MKRFQFLGLLPILGITLAALGTTSTPAQVFSTDGRSGVYVQGNGQAMAGTFDEKGFRGIAVGPDGKARRIEGQSPNPFSTSPREKSGVVRTPDSHGPFAGAVAGRAPIAPGGFDPFAFVFGQSAPMPGVGIAAFAGPMPSEELKMAKRAFRQGRYEDSLRIIQRAIDDGVVDIEAEQLRALTLFAMQEYDQAAASAYTVLESGAQWDWPTLQGMYSTRETYIEHLRALRAAAAEPTAMAGVHFLLAYHCLMLHQVDAAREALINTRQLQPENQLVPRLLASLPPSVD
jgi:hypothetical protein